MTREMIRSVNQKGSLSIRRHHTATDLAHMAYFYIVALQYIERVNSVIGLIMNSLLLLAIYRFSSAHLGTYKQLLTIFTLTDSFLIIIQAIVHPTVILAGLTHGVVTDFFIEHRAVGSLFIAFESVPFSLLVIHFLYRYWSVRRPHLISLFSYKPFLSLLLSGAAGGIISWYFLCYYGTVGEEDSPGRRALVEEYELKYGKRIETSWLLLDHWRDNQPNSRILLVVVVMNVFMICSVCLAATLASLTFYHIARAHKLSPQASLLQRKLLIALCAQATVPSICVYIPYLFTIDMPFLRIPAPIVHDLSVPLTTFFPASDATILILLISDYRRGLLGMIRKNNHVQMESSWRTTATQPSVNDA